MVEAGFDGAEDGAESGQGFEVLPEQVVGMGNGEWGMRIGVFGRGGLFEGHRIFLTPRREGAKARRGLVCCVGNYRPKWGMGQIHIISAVSGKQSYIRYLCWRQQLLRYNDKCRQTAQYF